MTRVMLMEQLKAFTEETIRDLLLPVPPPEYVEDSVESVAEYDETESGLSETVAEQPPRAAQVFLTALPERNSATKEAPYVLHQILKSTDICRPGELPATTIVARTVFCVYHENGQEGGMVLLNLMERLRIALLRQGVVGKQFKLDLSAGVETVVYPDTGPPPRGTAPYYLGEMITTWKTIFIEREVNYGKKGYSNIRESGPGCDQIGSGAVHGQYGAGHRTGGSEK